MCLAKSLLLLLWTHAPLHFTSESDLLTFPSAHPGLQSVISSGMDQTVCSQRDWVTKLFTSMDLGVVETDAGIQREKAETRAPQNVGRPRSGYHVCCALREPKGLTGRDLPCSRAVPLESRRNGGHVIYSSVSRVFPPRVG